MKLAWPAGIGYAAMGLVLVVAALARVPRRSWLMRWRNQPAVPLSPGWRVSLVTLGVLEIALCLLVAFGVLR